MITSLMISGSVTKKAIEEAMKEARMMRRYNHPNVVRFYGVQVWIYHWLIYLTMTFRLK